METTTLAARRSGPWRLDHAAYLFVALSIGAVFAFWPPYLSRLPNDDIHAHVHAILAVAWCALLVAQPLLVRRHRPLHRRLGAVSKVVAPLFVASTVLLAHHRFAMMSDATFAEDPASLYLGLIGTVLFSVSYALGLRYRRTTALHGRFMIATGLTMIDPVFVRVLGYYGPPFSHPLMYQVCGYGLIDLVLALLLWRPAIPPGNRRLFAAGVLIFPAAHLAWFTVVQGPIWIPFAYWFRSLPLP